MAALLAQLTLPFAESLTRDEAIQVYGADVAHLHRTADEADRFLQAILEQYLVETLDERVRAERIHDLRLKLPPLPRPANILSAKFLAQANEPGRELAQAIRADAIQLVFGFVGSLQSLAKRCVCGVIDWPCPDLCRFSFFDEVLSRTTTVSQQRKRKKRSPPAPSSTGRRAIGVDTVTESETTTDHRRLTKHEHHLVDATAVAPGYTRWPIPTRVESLIASAPPWIRRHLLVVEGTRIAERTITWESSNTSTRILGERDVPVYAPDPALVLGPFVLTGWSEPEAPTVPDAVATLNPPAAFDRSRLVATAVLGGVVLAGLLAADAVLRALPGEWSWPSGIAVVGIGALLVTVHFRRGLRRSPASDAISPKSVSSNPPRSDHS